MRIDNMIKRYIKAFALISALAISRICCASDLNSEWVGQISGPFDNAFTAQYSHVTLNTTGSKIGGKWGPYTIAGSLTGDKVTIELVEASGKSSGTLSGILMDGAFSG